MLLGGRALLAALMETLVGTRQDYISLKNMGEIIVTIVTGIGDAWSGRCSKDGPDARELYPLVYGHGTNKLVEMLSAAPVAMPPA